MFWDGVKLGCGVPTGIRTRVLALKGPRPRPLDDGDALVGATKDTTVDGPQPRVWIRFWGAASDARTHRVLDDSAPPGNPQRCQRRSEAEAWL